MNDLGQRLKQQREREQLTQVDLAELSGMTLDAICAIESGHVLPSKIQMEKLAAIYRLALTYEELRQWKANALHTAQHAVEDALDTLHWACPVRQWECPACHAAGSHGDRAKSDEIYGSGLPAGCHWRHLPPIVD